MSLSFYNYIPKFFKKSKEIIESPANLNDLNTRSPTAVVNFNEEEEISPFSPLSNDTIQTSDNNSELDINEENQTRYLHTMHFPLNPVYSPSVHSTIMNEEIKHMNKTIDQNNEKIELCETYSKIKPVRENVVRKLNMEENFKEKKLCQEKNQKNFSDDNQKESGILPQESQLHQDVESSAEYEEKSTAINEEAQSSSESDDFKNYVYPKDVAPNCPSIIGMKGKVSNSLSDKKKKGKYGTVTRWKNKVTIELECVDGSVFGILLKSVEYFVPQNQKEKVQEPQLHQDVESSAEYEEKSTAINEEAQSSSESDDFKSYVYPKDVAPNCPSIIGMKGKVSNSLSDKKKKGKYGTVTRWKNKVTIELECVDGSVFGILLKSMDFFILVDSVKKKQDTRKCCDVKLNDSRSKSKLKRSYEEMDVDHVETELMKSNAKRSVRPNALFTERNGDANKDTYAKYAQRENSFSMNESQIPTIAEEKHISGWGKTLHVQGKVINSDHKFGGRPVDFIRLKGENKSKEIRFLDELLGSHKVVVDDPISEKKYEKVFKKHCVFDGSNHELVSCKMYKDEYNNSCFPSEKARLIYAKSRKSDSKDSFSIQDQLLRIGDFTSLKPRKIVSRLELFQSPSSFNVVFLDKTNFSDIPDRGYVGGGFIQENKLVEVLMKAGMSESDAIHIDAIQVRLFIPSLGIYKGMLVKQRNSKGTSPIAIPWSMKKVLASKHPKAMSGGYVLICKTFPSKINMCMSRILDNPERVNDLGLKTFKPLTDMFFRLWKTMKVPKEMCEKYEKSSSRANGRNHAWLVGVPDPTNSLPPDTIFVPGMKNIHPRTLFVTRSPCYAYDHGRKIKNITSKPNNMSDQDWEWLQTNLSFGVVIFSNPRPGKKSIPERIANGDLDGDLYLVCWDENILSAMHAAPLKDEFTDDNGMLKTHDPNPNWFAEAQDIMADVGMVNKIGKLIGTLYKRGEKIADEDHVSVLRNKDANAFFQAYNCALEYKKHGRPIELPPHLIERVPSDLRCLIKSNNTKK